MTARAALCAALLFACVPLGAETITFSADSMRGNASKSAGGDRTVLEGNARIKTSTMDISAGKIELYGEDFRFIQAESGVVGTNTESELDFTCARMTYDRQTKVAVLEGAVFLTDRQNDVHAYAQRIEYDDGSQVAVMQIDVRLTQKDNTCTAAHAIYRKGDQMLVLEGAPQVTQGADTFRAQEIELNLDTQEIRLDGRVRGSVTVTEKEQPAGLEPYAESTGADDSAGSLRGTSDAAGSAATAAPVAPAGSATGQEDGQ